MWTGWDSLDASQLGAFDAHEFEDLVRELVGIETRDRWATPCALEGPSPPYVQDGARDLIVTAREPAHTSARDYVARWSLPRSLVADLRPGGAVVYSVKSGETFRRSLLDDARGGGVRVLPVLARGGGLIVVLREPLPGAPPRPRRASGGASEGATGDPAADRSERDALREELARAYAAREELAGFSASELLSRIELLDANDLAQYLRRRRPVELRDSSLDKLGVRRSSTLFDHERWVAEHQVERSWPEFQADPARERRIAQLASYLNTAVAAHPHVLVGPPGVGKTRLVMEAVVRASAAARVAVAEEAEEAVEELSGKNLLRAAPSVVLVVDDCPLHRVDRVLRSFRRAQGDEPSASGARLIVIVPHGEELAADEIGQAHEPLALAPLERDARLALIRQELDDDRVDAIDRSTAGYPWFAVLVAREVRDGAATPRSPTDAARLALASRAEQENDPRRVRRRARALLAVMLADNPRWTDLSEEDQQRLAHAVDLRDRAELHEELEACVRRGVLRALRRWYVTPGILEREVCRIATEGTDPGGPLLPRVRRHCPERLAGFVEYLQALGLDEGTFASLAAPLAEEVAASLDTLDDLRDPRVAASLEFSTRYAPAAIVAPLVDLIRSASVEELARRVEVRRPLVHALSGLARRAEFFATVEDALFRLRVAENEAYANNASAVWTWLFLPAVDLTDAPFEARFSVLQRRCREGPSPERVSAVRGLASLLSPFGVLSVSGGPPRPALDGGHRLRSYWHLLVSLSSDTDLQVAAAAQEELVKSLRPGIHRGLLDGCADALVEAVRGFHEAARVALRAEFEVERSLRGDEHEDLRPLWARLDVASRASDFGQRLRDRLHAHTDLVSDAQEAALDDALIAEGLRDGAAALIEHLDEFERTDAHRVAPLMITAGRLDVEGVLREALVARAEAQRNGTLVSFWALGRWGCGGEADVRALVDAWIGDERRGPVAVETMMRIGLDDGWTLRLVAPAREGRLDARSLYLLERASWQHASPTARRSLVDALLDRGGRDEVRVVLRHYDGDRAEFSPEDLTLIERALRAASKGVFTGHAAWSFYRCGLHLLDGGRARAACEAAVTASSHDELPGDGVWQLVEACAKRAPEAFWEALSQALSARSREAGRLLLRLAFHDVTEALPVDAALQWVGTDERRARAVASIVTFAGEALPAVARALLRRFGASSSVANALGARLASTTRGVPVLAEFYRTRFRWASRWAEDGELAVRVWALREAEELRALHASEAEDEALERRRYGT